MTKYCLERDESGDFYIIPVSKKNDWIEMLNTFQDKMPEWALHIGSYENITFETWEKEMRA